MGRIRVHLRLFAVERTWPNHSRFWSLRTLAHQLAQRLQGGVGFQAFGCDGIKQLDRRALILSGQAIRIDGLQIEGRILNGFCFGQSFARVPLHGFPFFFERGQFFFG